MTSDGERPAVSEIRPVRPNPSRVDRNLGLVTRLILVAILVAIAKPWAWFGDTAVGSAAPAILATPAPVVTSPPLLAFDDLAYNPSVFGFHEPPAVWDLLPAAYLVTYGFVFQPADQGTIPVAGPTPAAAQSPGVPRASQAAPSHSPAPSASTPADGGPDWPSRFEVPAGYHLFLIGIDMPPGVTLDTAKLERLGAADAATTVDISLPPSPWPSHFAAIGIPASTNPQHIAVWAPGRYRLSLVFGPTVIARTIEIDVLAPPVPAISGPTSEPTPSG